MPFPVLIYHTNDLHSHFEQWPKITEFIDQARAEHEHCFVFDIGDHVDRSHPITEASVGKANVALLNRLQYDDVTIGNNEGITLSHEQLNDLYSEANFNIVVANLFLESGARPVWAKPYTIKKVAHGIKIGVIGLTAPYEAFYKQLGWIVRDPFEQLPELLEEVRMQADIVILLSHLGINEDRQIARQFDVDLILGGHTHHLFEQGEVVNGTLLGAAGKFGMYIGEVQLLIDEKEKRMIKHEAKTIATAELNESLKTKAELSLLLEKSQKALSIKVCTLTENLPLSWFETTTLNNWLATGLKEWCRTEIAMLNAGVLLDGLRKGSVTKGDIHRICPHPINPCKLKLSGEELVDVIAIASLEQMETLEVKGLGFRGKVMGKMIYSGLEITHDQTIMINGAQLDLDRMYTIATLDMFTFGRFYPQLTQSGATEYFLPETLRDVLTWKLQQLEGSI